MEFGPSDSSGTDDDLPPSHQNRVVRGGRVAGNGRTSLSALAYPRARDDMEFQIHQLEQEAYCSVLRAFKAQSDAITWEKESLITELRKELRVSDEEHRELLSRVNADDIIRRIREWRQAGGHLSSLHNSAAQPMHDSVSSPTVSASRKRPKTSQSKPSLSIAVPSPALHTQPLAPTLLASTSAGKKGTAVGGKGKKPKASELLPVASSMKSMPYPSTGLSGRGQATNRSTTGAPAVQSVDGPPYDPLVGRKVWTRWPEDNSFYEAVITDYNRIEGRHALVYDINTNNETWEWVNLKEISTEDIRWEGEDPGVSHRAGRGGTGRGVKKTVGRAGPAPGTGRGRGTQKTPPKKDFTPAQNGVGKRNPDEIELLHTETLIKEVERVFNASHPDPVEVEKAKRVLKEHEQSLVHAISRLANASDGESEEGGRMFSQGQSMDRDAGWRNRQFPVNQQGANYEQIVGEGPEGSDGEQVAREGAASGYHQDGDDDNNI